jgi:dihydroxyacid dehydratase/phosphogluconate dehydratase
MKLSKMVETLEQDKQIKEKFINNCVDEFGSNIIEKPKITYSKIETKDIEWWDRLECNDNITEELSLHDLTTTLGIKEYNIKRVITLIVQGYNTNEIINKLHIGHVKLKKIKQLIYEKIKEAKQNNRI